MENILAVFSAPDNVFRSLRNEPKWLGAFATVTAGISLLAWLKSCLRGTSVIIDFGVLLGALVSTTSVFLFVWCIIALYLFAFTSLLNPPRSVRFKQVFSLVAYSGVIFLLGEVVNFALLHAAILKNVPSHLPNRFPIGLDVFFIGRSLGILPSIVLYSINPFTIWYFRTIAIGVHSISGLTKARSATISGSLWAVGIIFILTISSILGGTRIGITL